MKTYSEEVQEMIRLIREASQKEILPRFGKVSVKEKLDHQGVRDVVTEADLKASEYVLSRVREKFPGSYSEEHKHPDRFEGDLLWQLDPVDGTQEFIDGYSDKYAFHVALLQRQTGRTYLPVAGIIYLPGVDKLWFEDGSGIVNFVHKGVEKPLPTLRRDKLLCAQRLAIPSQNAEKIYRHLGSRLGLNVEIVETGATGATVSALLEGQVNLLLLDRNYSKDWDVAMAYPILKALGGFICDFDGGPFTYNGPDTKGHEEPYLLKGAVASVVFDRSEILPHINSSMVEDKLPKL